MLLVKMYLNQFTYTILVNKLFIKPEAHLGPPKFFGWSSLKHQLMVLLSPTDVARSFALEVARILDPALKIDVEAIYFIIHLILNFVYGSSLLLNLS